MLSFRSLGGSFVSVVGGGCSAGGNSVFVGGVSLTGGG